MTFKHVKDAYRLLKKSIIRVDQLHFDLEDDAPVPEDEEQPMETEKQGKKDFKLNYAH